MKYKVAIEVKAKVFVYVEAENFERAKIKAESAVCDYDFGVAQDIDWEAYKAIDENNKEEWF